MGHAGRAGVSRQKGQPGAISAQRREVDAGGGCNVAKQPIGHLHEDPRPIAGLGVGTERTAVSEVLERRQPEVDDRMTGAAPELGNERDAAGIVLVRGVVQPRRLSLSGHGVLSRSAGRSLTARSFSGDALGPLGSLRLHRCPAPP